MRVILRFTSRISALSPSHPFEDESAPVYALAGTGNTIQSLALASIQKQNLQQ